MALIALELSVRTASVDVISLKFLRPNYDLYSALIISAAEFGCILSREAQAHIARLHRSVGRLVHTRGQDRMAPKLAYLIHEQGKT